jgi:hypothetical protein
MAIRTELSLRLPNSPGSLARVCRLLSDERVNVQALTLGTEGQLRMVVDNHVHAAAVLRDHHHEVAERDVLVMAVPNTPGALAPALRLIKDADINVEYAYSGVGETGNTASIVIGVEHVLKASSVAGV